MKITAIETHVCHARMRNWIFVKVLHRSGRPVGLGRGDARMAHARRRRRDRRPVAQLLVGEDPTRIEHLWQMMYRQHFWHGNGIVRGTAITGIDIALWDILGKVARRALPQALGRAGARLRAHLLPPRRRARWKTSTRRPPTTPTRFADLARQAVEDGFTAFKSMAVPPTMPHRRAAADPLRRGLRAPRCARPSATAIDIMVDCHARPSPAHGPAVRQGAGAVRPVLLRRALLAGSVDGLAEIQRAGRDADRHRRAADEPGSVPRPVRRAGLRASASPTSRTAAA